MPLAAGPCDDVGMDPLTAVVIFAIAGAAAAVAILQMDQDATASISLPLDDFVSGALPAVCCKTGEPADARVQVRQRRLFRTVVEGVVPVTKVRLAEFSGWRGLYRKAAVAFYPLAVVGLAIKLAADSLVVSWAVDLPVLAVLFLAIYSYAKARRLLVSPRLGASGTVSLRSLHPAFVDAVRATRQPAA